MPLITFWEVIDLFAMTVFVGYIFSDMLQVKRHSYDPLIYHKRLFDTESLKIAVIATAPAIILHELAHKFVAIGFGLDAVFMAFYRNSFTLFLGFLTIISKFTGMGFMFFVPGFVSISGNGSHLQFALTALAGPLVNLALWLSSSYLLKKKKCNKYYMPLILTKKINMFLFIFNILPIPGFDGYKIFSELTKSFIS